MEKTYEKLMDKFPLLYRDRHASMKVSCMCWGIDCGIGWYDLILELSQKLEELISALPEDVRGHHYAAQVKEKFGGLRFYMAGGTDEMYRAIELAEKVSYHTCERCGKPGKVCGGGWVVTLCNACHDQESNHANSCP